MPILTAVPNCPCCGRAVDVMADLRWNVGSRVLCGRGKTVTLSPLRTRIFDAYTLILMSAWQSLSLR
jgi:hypothetical protein